MRRRGKGNHPAADLPTLIESARQHWNDTSDAPGALDLFNRALALAEAAGDLGSTAHVLSRLGVIHTSIGKFGSAIDYLSRALDHRDAMSHDDLVYTLRLLGDAETSIGRADKGIGYLNEALDSLTAEDGFLRAQVLTSIAGVHMALGDLDRAVELTEETLELYRALDDEFSTMRTLGNLTNLEVQRHNVDRARVLCDEMLPIARRVDRPYPLGYALMIAAAVRFEGSELREAEEAAQEVADLAAAHAFLELRATALDMQLAVCERLDRLLDARMLGAQVLEISRSTGRKSREADARLRLATIEERVGDPSKSIEHLREYIRLREEVAGEERQRAVAELQARFALDRLERDRRHLTEQIDRLRSDLATTALNAINQRALLEDMLRRLKAIRAEGGGDEQLRRLISEIETRLDEEPEWAAFEPQFATIHATFLPALLTRFPTLSPAEAKVCALTRLNLSTKQIAKLLAVDPRTVQNHRLSIRRKLGLGGRENLHAFLTGLG